MDHEKGLLTEGSSKKDYHIVLLVMLVFFVISLITNILNSIIVDVKESFDLSLTMTGFLPFTFFIAYGVMSIPAGVVSVAIHNKCSWSNLDTIKKEKPDYIIKDFRGLRKILRLMKGNKSLV